MTEPKTGSVGHVRWIICALLFFAATINYIDRQVIGILKPTLEKEFGWTRARLRGDRVQLPAGLRDRPGAGRPGHGPPGDPRGFALAVVLWSLAAMAHAAADWFPGLKLPTLLDRPASPSCCWAERPRASPWPVSRSASARPATSRPRSRRWRSGSRRRNARWPPASSTPARTSARCSRRWRAVDHAALGLAVGLHRHGRDGLRLGGVLAWLYAPPEAHPTPVAGRTGLHPQRPGRSHGADPLACSCCRTARPGPSPSASS